MNKFEAIGRLTADPVIKEKENNVKIANFTLAIPRRYKNSEGEHETDFVNCVAFRSRAEFLEKYLRKGNRISVVGRIQTGSYLKEDTTIYYTQIVVEEIENLTPRPQTAPTATEAEMDEFIPTGEEDPGLPFN